MKVPNAENLRVDRQKIVGYLLCDSHPDGASKAEFFSRFGFGADRWRLLAEALRQHGQTHEVASTAQSTFGARYVVDGTLEAPDGRSPRVRSVWIVDDGDETPRLVTAHPA